MRKDGTVLLNDIQFATYNALLEMRDSKGIIPADAVSVYKANVIKGILKYRALERFQGNKLRVPVKNPPTVMLMPEPVARGAAVEVELQEAA
jgi:hypothetical protein